jgi:hypothetical protein
MFPNSEDENKFMKKLTANLNCFDFKPSISLCMVEMLVDTSMAVPQKRRGLWFQAEISQP